MIIHPFDALNHLSEEATQAFIRIFVVDDLLQHSGGVAPVPLQIRADVGVLKMPEFIRND